MLVEWGGKDDYVFSFIPEVRQNDEVKVENEKDTLEDGKLHHHMNNNDTEQENFNLVQRKVSQVNISMSGN